MKYISAVLALLFAFVSLTTAIPAEASVNAAADDGSKVSDNFPELESAVR
jgi:hypothetical protein